MADPAEIRRRAEEQYTRDRAALRRQLARRIAAHLALGVLIVAAWLLLHRP